MNARDAITEWRRRGGVLETIWDNVDGQTWHVRDVFDGEDWRSTCRDALREAGWSEERIAREMRF
jgi:hypothetical protein